MLSKNRPLYSKILEFYNLYKLSEKAYKSVQVIVLKIDDKIHNEFRYSRGLAEVLSEVIKDEPNEQEVLGCLQRANHAVRNAFNDSIDLIVAYCDGQIRVMSGIDNDKPLSYFIPDLKEILEANRKLSDQIKESRGNLESRIEIYKNILDSYEFKRVVSFCENSPILLNAIKAENINFKSRVERGRRRFIITIVSAAAAILGAVIKFPEIYKWFTDTF
jgi:hypothetical protein